MIRKLITDYNENKDAVDKWLEVKGETKYLEFATILIHNNIPVTWINVSNLYRYDKRLLINVFKYISFLEEYIRAVIYNHLGESYENIESMYFIGSIDTFIKQDIVQELLLISKEKIRDYKDYINQLRNCISHNKIVLNYKYKDAKIKDVLLMLKQVLPNEYQKGYISDINKCAKKLVLNDLEIFLD